MLRILLLRQSAVQLDVLAHNEARIREKGVRKAPLAYTFWGRIAARIPEKKPLQGLISADATRPDPCVRIYDEQGDDDDGPGT
jgi:hypothetical protein